MTTISDGELGSSVRAKLNATGLLKNNLSASAAPTVGDDTGDGYEVGSLWIDTTNDQAYVALDVSSGAAVWQNLGSGGFSQEEIEDFVGAMFSGNTETLITATYQDADGTIDLVVDNDLSNYDNTTSGFLTTETDPVVGAITGLVKADGAGNISAAVADTDYQSVPSEGAFADGDKTKLDGIEALADVTDATNVAAAGAAMASTLASTANGEGASLVGIEDVGGNFTATDVEGALAELAGASGGFTQEQIEDFVGAMVGGASTQTGITVSYDDANGELDFVVDTETDPVVGAVSGIVKADGAGNISAAVANTDYQAVLSEGAFANGDKTKLDGIEALADVTDGANVKSALEGLTLTSITSATGDEYLVIDATDGGLKAVTHDNLPSGGGGISNVVEDTTPQLGGSLDVNGNAIVSVSNGDIAITPNGTGSVVLDGLSWPQADGSANQVLKTDGAGQIGWATVSGGDVDGGSASAAGDAIQIRGDTAANWTSSNPTLAAREIGYETDTGFFKVGDGSTEWNSLGYTLSGLADPGADRIVFWDDSAGAQAYLTAGTGLSISGTTMTVTGLTVSEIAAGSLTGSDTDLVTGTAGTSGNLVSWDANGDAVDSSIAASDVAVQAVTENAQTGTTYTLVLGDASKLVSMSNASANTLTIPTNASVAFPVGTTIVVMMKGAGTTTITGATGVTVNGVSAGSGDISAQWGMVSLFKSATDTWYAGGSIGTVA